MALSSKAVKRLIVSLTDKVLGNEVASAVNNGAAVASQASHVVAGMIVATSVSQTVDFGSLAVGDKVLHIGAAAGNAQFVTVAVAGTLGIAAVIGDLYVVIRAVSLPSASSEKL